MRLLRVTRCAAAALAVAATFIVLPHSVVAQETNPPLHVAAARGDMREVARLLVAGAPVDQRGGGDHTALMAAASYGYADIVTLLIGFGADPDLRDAQGRTALARAERNGKTEAANVLRPHTTASSQTSSSVAPASPAPPAARTKPAAAPASPAPRAAAAPPAAAPPAPAAPAAAPATAGPFSRAELLEYLRSIPNSQDVSVPYEVRKDAHDRLTRLVRQRGVDFVLSMGTFDREFYEAGASSLTRLAIDETYRDPGSAAPARADESYFPGTWAMGAAGATTRYDRQGSGVVRTDQLTGAVGGYLQIDAGGSYAWRHSRSEPEIRGRWRGATERELGTEAGAGIVLLAGYDNGNWLVVERPSEVAGEHITVSNLAQRYRYFIGSR